MSDQSDIGVDVSAVDLLLYSSMHNMSLAIECPNYTRSKSSLALWIYNKEQWVEQKQNTLHDDFRLCNWIKFFNCICGSNAILLFHIFVGFINKTMTTRMIISTIYLDNNLHITGESDAHVAVSRPHHISIQEMTRDQI